MEERYVWSLRNYKFIHGSNSEYIYYSCRETEVHHIDLDNKTKNDWGGGEKIFSTSDPKKSKMVESVFSYFGKCK